MNQSKGFHSETKGNNYKRLAWPAFGVVAVVALLIGVWKLPQRQASNLKQRIESEENTSVSREKLFELENTTRENYLKVIQSFGGLGFLFTGYFAWRNLQTAEKNRELAERTAETNRINAEENRDFAERTAEVNRKLAEDKQVTERFSKAVELLSEGNKLEARIGGIYLLESIAKDSPKDQETVWEVLMAFIRKNSSHSKTRPNLNVVNTGENLSNPFIQANQNDEKISSNRDIQAIATVMGRRQWAVTGRINFSRSDLQGANLQGANLNGATLHEANLNGANLQGANLYGADLGRANLNEAYLNGADLREADLRMTDLQMAVLEEANLQGADLKGADLQLANLNGADLREADLRGAKGINSCRIEEAKNWQEVTYSDDIKIQLGLATAPKAPGKNLEE